MPRARVNGIELHYEERGEGGSILCIHGAGSSALVWEPALEELGQLGRVIAYDRRGCARSVRPQPYEHTTVAEQADDAAALLDSLDAGPAVVVARSYGGAVATDLALRHPRQVRALALLEGDALGLSSRALEWTRGMRARLREVAERQGVEEVAAALIAEVADMDTWQGFPEEVRQVLSANGPALLAELHYVDEPLPDADAIAAIAVPALLVAASESPPEQHEMTAAMAAALPNARTVTVGGGHLVDPAAPEVLAFVAEALGRDEA